MDKEIWKSLPECTSYEVSSFGSVRRVKPGRGTRAMRQINPSKDAGGRMVFNISVNGNRKQIKLHRAVAQAFFGPCPDGCEVAHLDGNQKNNAVSNLAYVTPKENNRHKVAHGTQPVGEKIWCSKLKPDEVIAIRAQYPSLSYAKLAKKYNVSTGSIVQVVKRKSWKHI